MRVEGVEGVTEGMAGSVGDEIAEGDAGLGKDECGKRR